MQGLKDLWVWGAIAIVITGIAAQSVPVVILGFVVGLVCAGAIMWSRASLRRLTYERVVPEDRAFPGDVIGVTLRVINRKRLPLPWIEVRDAFPEAMVGDEPAPDIRPTGQAHQMAVEWRVAATGFERINRPYQLRAPERGVYYLGPATVRSGDPFGLFPELRVGSERTRLLVYPKLVDVGEQVLPARRPFGEVTGGLRVFEDPSRVAGLRDYEPGDSMRRIDWNATARLGRLQSKVYEPTSSHHLLVCLNTATLTPHWAGFIPGLFEGGISIAAAIALQAHEERYAVGLLATSSVIDDNRAIRILPGRETHQLLRILEALATVTPYVLESLAAMLDREEYRMSAGTSLAVVTATMPDDLVVTLHRLQKRGHPLVVLTPSGNRWDKELEGIEVRHLTWPDGSEPNFRPPVEVAL